MFLHITVLFLNAYILISRVSSSAESAKLLQKVLDPVVEDTKTNEGDDKPVCVITKNSETFNLYAAMNGYDPFMANPFDRNGDPAVRNQIFRHYCIKKSPTIMQGYWNFIGDVRKNMHCDADFSLKSVSSGEEYEKERGSSNSVSESAHASAGGGWNQFSFKASAGYTDATNTESSDTTKIFKKYNGEVIMAKATCITNVISISEYVRPFFTKNFRNALQTLDDVSKGKDDKLKKAAFKQFVSEFGTAYMKKTSMGSELLYEKRFTSRSKSSEHSTDRKECAKFEAKVEASGGAYGFQLGGGYEQMKEKCESNADADKLHASYSSEATRTIARGSRPKDLKAWVDADFTPVPIHRELMLISNLFRQDWVTKSPHYGFHRTLNAKKINETFVMFYYDYCEILMSDWVNPDCTPKPTCSDGLKNGEELGVDCGGPKCNPCHDCILTCTKCGRGDNTKPCNLWCSSQGSCGSSELHQIGIDCRWCNFKERMPAPGGTCARIEATSCTDCKWYYDPTQGYGFNEDGKCVWRTAGGQKKCQAKKDLIDEKETFEEYCTGRRNFVSRKFNRTKHD